MEFPEKYRFSDKNKWEVGSYQLVPIKYDDMFNIMKWRNDQIYHLRQNKPLTEEEQQNYFDTVVRQLYEQDYPNQLLFSYLEKGKLIGYGGLVHINWNDRNAEISFIMDTKLEERYFEFHWNMYLRILEKIAFRDLSLHKIYTFAFDLRPRLYTALESAGFKHEATLTEHCRFGGRYIDVRYHAKINRPQLRYATKEDLDITYCWAKDPKIRKYSFNQNEIEREEHVEWFSQKLKDKDCFYFIMEDVTGEPLGSIRIDLKENEGLISYLIDSNCFGKGLGTEILRLLEQKIKEDSLPVYLLNGYVYKDNIASIKIFQKLGYNYIDEKDQFKFFKKLI